MILPLSLPPISHVQMRAARGPLGLGDGCDGDACPRHVDPNPQSVAERPPGGVLSRGSCRHPGYRKRAQDGDVTGLGVVDGAHGLASASVTPPIHGSFPSHNPQLHQQEIAGLAPPEKRRVRIRGWHRHCRKEVGVAPELAAGRIPVSVGGQGAGQHGRETAEPRHGVRGVGRDRLVVGCVACHHAVPTLARALVARRVGVRRAPHAVLGQRPALRHRETRALAAVGHHSPRTQHRREPGDAIPLALHVVPLGVGGAHDALEARTRGAVLDAALPGVADSAPEAARGEELAGGGFGRDDARERVGAAPWRHGRGGPRRRRRRADPVILSARGTLGVRD
mmetsp:Transcript_42437/g.100907  ORF Transcript_42437/g.100907 Transcript_42437/m.100907 type:complete len:338 (+) Transcript_42437:1766-2779(+)